MLPFLSLLALIFSSCNSSSIEDYKEIGQAKAKELFFVLKKIHSRDELMDAEADLERCYEEIADILLLAKKSFKKPHEDEIVQFTVRDRELNEKIRLELLRIYRLEGGKEILEKCQKKALDKLS